MLLLKLSIFAESWNLTRSHSEKKKDDEPYRWKTMFLLFSFDIQIFYFYLKCFHLNWEYKIAWKLIFSDWGENSKG